MVLVFVGVFSIGCIRLIDAGLVCIVLYCASEVLMESWERTGEADSVESGEAEALALGVSPSTQRTEYMHACDTFE